MRIEELENVKEMLDEGMGIPVKSIDDIEMFKSDVLENLGIFLALDNSTDYLIEQCRDFEEIIDKKNFINNFCNKYDIQEADQLLEKYRFEDLQDEFDNALCEYVHNNFKFFSVLEFLANYCNLHFAFFGSNFTDSI